ncbi:hypothetical protein M758_5G028800 [Ceratodon purpureus]|nr:hypothetical protein M758_5G028800 [Ceratodon purpureus]
MCHCDAPLQHLGGVATACDPSGSRRVRTWGAGYGPAGACGGPAHSKLGVTGAVWPEGEAAAVLERRVLREAGDRAANTSRPVQWRDSGPECLPQTTLPGMLSRTTFSFFPLSRSTS